MASEITSNLREWSPAAEYEPLVRVGMVLEADGKRGIRIDLPPSPYILSNDAGEEYPCQGASVLAEDADRAVAVRIDDQEAVRAPRWRLTPRPTPPLSPAAGAVVHDVVAGRGFHWRKTIDQTLPHTMELFSQSAGLCLVNELPVETYLAGVITSEMGSACPAALLRAQGVVARSWLLAMAESKHDADPFDRCNDDCCQRYQGVSDLNEAALSAVRSTRGEVLLDEHGQVVDANYSKSCGGISEPPETLWGISKPGLSVICDAPPDSPARRFLPVTAENLREYLEGDWWRGANVYCSPEIVPEATFSQYLGRVDEIDNYFRWRVRYTRAALEDLLRKQVPEMRTLATLHDLRVTARGPSGRASEVEIDWEDADGRHATRLAREYRIRKVLHDKFLYSSAFAVHIERDAGGLPAFFELRGAGWGHGAGLCQIGALGMALQGVAYGAICRHYFPEARLAKVY